MALKTSATRDEAISVVWCGYHGCWYGGFDMPWIATSLVPLACIPTLEPAYN